MKSMRPSMPIRISAPPGRPPRRRGGLPGGAEMRIGIDGRMLFMSGIGTYLRNLLAGLARLDAAGEYVLFLRPADRERFAAPGANFRVVTADAEPYSLAE